jgi:lysophospholipase L1-like esterase
LRTLEPQIVVINLSNNDREIDWFARNIEKMIEISLANHIQPILILEPNSVERNDARLFVKHEIMRNVGTSKKVPVIDMHSHLRQMNDKGFLWWDLVHLTDFGQKLFAEKLLEDVSPFLSP